MSARDICQRFANDHKLIFEDKGECGFGRPCVGFLKNDCYVAHNPYRSNDYAEIPEFADDRLRPPDGVPDAYHKHDCLAVLAHDDDYERAIEQLARWVTHIESIGRVSVERYETGAQGIQAVFSGSYGYTLKLSEKA